MDLLCDKLLHVRQRYCINLQGYVYIMHYAAVTIKPKSVLASAFVSVLGPSLTADVCMHYRFNFSSFRFCVYRMQCSF